MFPHQIWTGQTRNRPDLGTVKAPDHGDWVSLCSELVSIQEYILSLSDNMEVMPNLKDELENATNQVSNLLSKIDKLSIPEIQKNLNELNLLISEIDTRESHQRLKNGVKKLFLRTKKLETAYTDLKNNTNYEMQVFTNNFRNALAKLSSEVHTQLKRMQDQIAELQDVLETPDLGS
jgi:phosphoenolpyruvate carboxylase